MSAQVISIEDFRKTEAELRTDEESDGVIDQMVDAAWDLATDLRDKHGVEYAELIGLILSDVGTNILDSGGIDHVEIIQHVTKTLKEISNEN